MCYIDESVLPFYSIFLEFVKMKLNLNDLDYEDDNVDDYAVKKFEPIPVKQKKQGESNNKHSKSNKQARGKDKTYNF